MHNCLHNLFNSNLQVIFFAVLFVEKGVELVMVVAVVVAAGLAPSFALTVPPI